MSTLVTAEPPHSPLPHSLFRRREADDAVAAAASAGARGKAMYLSEKPRPVDYYKEEEEDGGDIVMEMVGNGDLSPVAASAPPPLPQPQQQQQMVLGESSGEDHEVKAPKKRAETWVQEETRSLVSLRREMDGLFNTSKSNKHLWEQISAKMRDKGFDRSPTMCTDKWRNLLKEFKKAKQQGRAGGGPPRMSCYKEIEELLKERNKNGGGAAPYKGPTTPTAKVDSYLQFSDKGLEDAGIPFESVEARSTINLDRGMDHDGLPLAITAADAVGPNGVPPWGWRDASGNGGDSNAAYSGRVIFVKCGDYTRKIGIDGTADAIKEAIKSAFGLRTRRAFWLEDEDEVVRSLDKEMPLGTYTLHLDEGLTIKVCTYNGTDRLQIHTEEKTLYAEEDFRDFLRRRGWTGLREYGGFRTIDSLDELRPSLGEFGGFRTIDSLDELRPGAVYEGVRLLGE